MKATKEQLKARAAKVLDEYQTMTGKTLNEAEYGFLCSAMAEQMCDVAIEALQAAAQPGAV